MSGQAYIFVDSVGLYVALRVEPVPPARTPIGVVVTQWVTIGSTNVEARVGIVDGRGVQEALAFDKRTSTT